MSNTLNPERPMDGLLHESAEWLLNAYDQHLLPLPLSDGDNTLLGTEEGAHLLNLRDTLVLEELEEYVEAVRNSDRVETLDAVCDLMVTISGTLRSLGYQSIYTREDLGTVIPTEFLADPELVVVHTVEDFLGSLSILPLLAEIPWADLHETHVACTRKGLVALSSLITAADWYGFPLVEAFTEVHRSNKSKAIEVIVHDEMGGQHTTYKVTKNEAGKTLKPDTYSAPDLATVLEGHEEPDHSLPGGIEVANFVAASLALLPGDDEGADLASASSTSL